MNPIGGKTCPICKTGVSRTQAAQAGHCGAVACRTAFAVEHQKARAEDMLAAWHASAADVAAQAGMRVGGAVPRQTAPLERPDPDRIAVFRAHLRRIVMASLFENSDEAAIAAEEATASRMDAAPVVAAGCATCRGRCCSMGAPQQAFLTVRTMTRVRRRAPGIDPEALIARYMDRMPERSTADACLFQGAQGCTLPRADRAHICNTFVCQGLELTLAAARAHPGTPIAIGAFDGQDLAEISIVAPGEPLGTDPPS